MSEPLFILITGLLGFCIGSFLNVLIWRMPQDKPITGRSSCPYCHHQLGPMDLVPIASYLLSRGKCRYCKGRVSVRYPVIELATGVLFAVVASFSAVPVDFQSALLLLRTLVIISVCIVVFVIDLEHYLILDNVILPATGLVLLISIALDILLGQRIVDTASVTGSGVVAALVAVLPFWAIWFFSGGKWMGFGDVKYVAFMGLALGIGGTAIGLYAAFMIGAFFSVILLAMGKKQLSSKVPFGTFLTIGTIIALFWGEPLWSGYRAIIGL